MGKQVELYTVIDEMLYKHYYNRLKSIALSMFEWKNLPTSIDSRFLELQLFSKGCCLFSYDEIAECYVITTGQLSGTYDIYNNSTKRIAIASNGYYRNGLTKADSVIIYNNFLRESTSPDMEIFAYRLWECQRSINSNIMNQKFPYVILTTKAQELTAKNLFKKVQNNEPVVFADKSVFEENQFTLVPTQVPYVADKLRIERHDIWDEAMSFLGIENSNTDKKERLVSSEVNGNAGSIESQRNSLLSARKQACEMINNIWGLDTTVTYRSDLETLLNKNNLFERKPESQLGIEVQNNE
jgi:hypothetical protein